MQGKAASSAGMRRARGAASALLARRDRAARQPHGGPIGYSGRSCRWCLPGRRLCAHSGTPVLVPDTWSLRPPDEDQNTCDRRLPLVWRRCIHAATDTVVRRPHRRPPRAPLTRSAMVHRQARGRAALPANHARRERDYPHAKQEGEIGGGSALYIYNNWSMQWGIHAGSPPS